MSVKKRFKNDKIECIMSYFCNNMFQLELSEFLEKNEINYKTLDMDKMTDILKFSYENVDYVILIYTNQSFSNDFSSKAIFEKIEAFNKNKIYLLFYESEEIIKDNYNEFLFFVETQLQVKTYMSNSKQDFFDFIANLVISITIKEDKSKINFFESKFSTHSNLCKAENITDLKQITWVEHLMCIPGVSERKAIAISKEFNSFKSLMDCYISDDYSEMEKKNFFKDIEIEDKNKDKISKIGQTISLRIYTYFTATDHNTIIN